MSINDKLDRVVDRLGKVDRQLGIYNTQLKEHMKRTKAIEDRIVPLEKLQYKLAGALALLSTVAIIASIVEILIKIK